MAPTPNATVSVPPTPAPSKNETTPTDPPTVEPTAAPTTKKHHHHHHRHHPSIGKIIGKTIAWLIIIALGVLLFGFVMSNRYRIYYYLRSAWYSFLRNERTMWVLRKLRLDRFFGLGDPSLNGIIFDSGDLHEGLLMQDT